MKPMSAGALFFNELGELLLVKPTYKDGWEIPGGWVEAGESPKEGCLREIREELGLEVQLGPLLAVDYKSRKGEQPESLQFVFYGGVLPPSLIQAIRLPPAELAEHRFVAPDQALCLLPMPLSQRVAVCLPAIAEQRTLVLHDGHAV